MTNVFDVAKYILEKKGDVSAMKLQKLCYYAQVWYATWEERSLFPECIEAWINGPVIPELYKMHRGKFLLTSDDTSGNSDNLTKLEKEDIDKVIEYYGDKDPQWLSDLTHSEDPYINARKGVPDRERSNKEITLESIAEYYGSLQ